MTTPHALGRASNLTPTLLSSRGRGPIRLRAPLGLLFFASCLGGCVPDLDTLRGPALNVGGSSGASGNGGCDGGRCETPGGGAGGSASGAGGNGGASGSASGGSSGSSGSGGSASAVPQLRYDFELESAGLQGWAVVPLQRPAGVLDRLERSSDAAHSGQQSARMVFNGTYPDAGPPTDPFYGIQRMGGPPADAEVTFWMMTTAPGVTIEVFAQTGTTYTWNVLTSLPLTPDEWREFDVFIPPSSAGALSNWGMKLYTPFDVDGSIYLDEVTW